ncbi:MAG TPA: hypothetical protein VLU25_06415 [Acidobacteriota bacterium]|nr:hypothetical protein [Acidobacteriota bacterium]
MRDDSRTTDPNSQRPSGDQLEMERYELERLPAYRFELSRRRFVELFGGGIAVGFLLPKAVALAQESGGGRRRGRQTPQEISAWLHIAEDGSVSVYTRKVEV